MVVSTSTPHPRRHRRQAIVRLATAWVLVWTHLSPVVDAAQRQPFVERVDVGRVVIDARVLDGDGLPIEGLGPDDFEVTIDGRAVRVESAQWYGGRDGPPLESDPLDGILRPERQPRLVVFVVQKSLERRRAGGLLRVLGDSDRLLAPLRPGDRAAVLVFDAHLEVWLDFTDDLDRVRHTLANDVMRRDPPPVEPSRSLSLVNELPTSLGRDTHSIENALQVLGEALEPLPGSKSVVMVGYGFGQLTVTLGVFGSRLDRDYGEARAALQAARAAVFCLDVTDADYHTFEHGLRTVADDSGGFFMRTHLFSRRAIDRVAQALVGHYVLFAEHPPGNTGYHEIEVSLAHRPGTVYARNGFSD